jgi:hypothetical protein
MDSAPNSLCRFQFGAQLKSIAYTLAIANILAVVSFTLCLWLPKFLYPGKPLLPRGDFDAYALLISMLIYAVTWFPGFSLGLFWFAKSQRRGLRICLWAWLLLSGMYLAPYFFGMLGAIGG